MIVLYIGGYVLIITAMAFWYQAGHYDHKGSTGPSDNYCKAAICCSIIGITALLFSGGYPNSGYSKGHNEGYNEGHAIAEQKLTPSYDLTTTIELTPGDSFSIIFAGTDGKLADRIEKALTAYVKEYPSVRNYEGFVWKPKNLVLNSPQADEFYTGWFQATWTISNTQPGIMKIECVVNLKHPPIIIPDEIGPLGKNTTTNN